MWILAFFARDGEPATGLLPLIKISEVSTSAVVVSGASMIEKGDGFYGYDFSAYNPQEDYAIICDSVTLSGAERYTYATSGEYNEVLDSIESTVSVVDLRTLLIRKIHTNRLELFDGDSDNWILYDDDAVTPLLTFSVSDKDGTVIVQQPHTPSRRNTASGTISGAGTPDYLMRKSVYDPDDDGIVNAAENVSDGVYTSTASGVYQAVINTHSPYQLGTKFITESGIGNNKFIKYDSASGMLVYTNVSGAGGTAYHDELFNRDIADQHPASSISTDTTSFSGVLSSSDTDVQISLETLDQNVYTKSEINALIGNNKSGTYALSLGDVEATITFPAAFTDDSYKLFYSLENEVDSPSSEYAITTIEKTAGSFKVHFSGEIDSNNYELNWFATTSGVGSCAGIIEVHDDTSPELGGDLYINSFGLEMDTTPSGNVIHGYTIGYSGEISQMYVDWNDTGVGCPLHMKSNGHWEQCSAASGTVRMPCGALALEEDTGLKKILWRGIARKGAWSWTPGNIIYVSTVDGALTSVAPTSSGSWQQPVGFAIASDSIRFDPGFYPGVIV
jgi:hypothetical protein